MKIKKIGTIVDIYKITYYFCEEMEKNIIYNCDVLDGLSRLEDSSIDLIITSPPYNKAGLNGVHKDFNWKKTIDYGGDVNNDNMDELEYQQWQIDILNECYRVLKPEGSMFYNHKNRQHRGKGQIISPYCWLFQTPFLIRQEIIWNRRVSPNVEPTHYLPSTEQIYWLTKQKSVRFKRQMDCQCKGEVWDIGYSRNSAHPAPFPVEIPDNIIPCVAQGERITVLDPFMGSGTVAVSAVKNGCDYIGFELFPEYIEMAEKRLKNRA